MEKSITVTRTVEGPFEAISDLLEKDPGGLLSAATEAAAAAANEVIVHLEGKWKWFDLDESVEAEVGTIERTNSMARLPLSWKADSHKRLLPSLNGHLGLYNMSSKHSELSYTATYAPPLGLFGGLEDFLLGRRILESVLGRFLEELVLYIEEQTADS